MPAVDRTASLPLDFLVIGGGVGGLAVAYVLAKSGHRVRVLEKRDLDVPSGGHRVPPNLSKILRHWVGEEELMKVSSRCVGTPFHHLRTGDLVGYLHWKPAVMAETGGDFLLMHHDDLIRMLYKLATEAGARVDFHTEVTAIQPGSDSIPNPSVTLANGDVLTADMVVGADGYRSLVREVVLEEEDMAKPGGMTLYTGVVPAEEMLKDPELRPYALSDEWAIWMGPYRSVCGHPVRAKKEFFFHVYSWHGKDGLEQVGEENWEELFPTSDLKTENHGPKVQRMIKLASNVIRTRFMTRPVIDDWTDYTGRIVLLGDAAHPSFPGGSHPAAMAVEDAVVFGSLFSHLRTLDQIPSFTSAYQELRQRRCELVKQADIANAQMVSMPDGPMAEARDEDMRRRKDEWDEGTLKAQFEEIAEIFLYDAGDAAEEWWVNWGRFSETAREQPHVVDFSNFTTVTVSQE
ncbi:FAD/NAD-P-binding domain-containing protein [Trametes coccinea BRFM310]|uniref:FAD/NAD-P-binding domain-containing protein n=1 Tax=Trametes coccinea (strain BRFM310) TaxID=1353009 RepID=A0A1Y2IXK0_TRAC3|nr:FAD/NAD-P-binding domain-containing protein [Trametes coccinea BRFM310]